MEKQEEREQNQQNWRKEVDNNIKCLQSLVSGADFALENRNFSSGKLLSLRLSGFVESRSQNDVDVSFLHPIRCDAMSKLAAARRQRTLDSNRWERNKKRKKMKVEEEGGEKYRCNAMSKLAAARRQLTLDSNRTALQSDFAMIPRHRLGFRSNKPSRMSLLSSYNAKRSVRVCDAANRTTSVRSWDEMNYDVLVDIIRRVSLKERLYVVCMVSKTWLSAVLDLLSRNGVINLKVLDSPKYRKMHGRYFCFLKRMLDTKAADSCSELLHGETFYRKHKMKYIGKRTPYLKTLVIPQAVGLEHEYIIPAIVYWKELKKVQCPVGVIARCPSSFTKVETLCLFGHVDDYAAAIVRDWCPQLKHLSLHSCALSMKALSTILDGHKNLDLLNTRHSFRVPDGTIINRSGCLQALDWNEEEIQHKAAGVKVHLRCARGQCAKCAEPYRCCFPEQRSPYLKPPQRFYL
ncbi:uncharacterized protein LOC104892494 [Beta vulgaris subsp. vulgaris]|uniref:uncharacterized protein LOC104892494 n=1 Tax=Beta vulgaris subsp. vulgaris TaxID=3555 RepID=UPI002036E215|nr:uncharacterized protein LOC104892494 [Beta vulgaris subsp. vulgaris]